MYDIVRFILLGLLFASLFAVWFWSRRQAANNGPLGPNAGSSFKILQKRWVDQKTGVCLVEAEDKTFLLAYTVGGSVSWQPLEKAKPDREELINRLSNKSILPGPDRK